MENFIYLLPIFGCVIALIFCRNKFVFYEYIMLIFISMLVTFFLILLFKYTNCQDIEYRGDYVTRIEHYEPWNEWVHRTCTRTIKVGKTTTTQSYDCSYCRHHPEEWLMITSEKKRYNITKADYNRMCSIWNTKQVFVDMNRNYHTLDGDMYMIRWDKNPNTLIPITTSNEYQNRVISSKSVFKFEDISKEDAIQLKLYEYPKIKQQYYPLPSGYGWDKNTFQDALIGYSNPKISKKLNYINAFYGPSKHIRTYILVFKNMDRDIAFKQISYWCGGNFNEHIICIGTDYFNDITWVETFSWEDVPTLAVKTKQYLLEINSINSLDQFLNWYESILKSGEWKCKDAEDFNYLKRELNLTQIIIILIITFIVVIGIFCFGYYNDDKLEK